MVQKSSPGESDEVGTKLLLSVKKLGFKGCMLSVIKHHMFP